MVRRIFSFLFFSLLVTGIFAQNNNFGQARWITSSHEEPESKRPCISFKKDFIVHKGLVSAKLYITALGLYEAKLNDYRIGKAYFTPGWTDYNKRLKYQEYDLNKISTGVNHFEVTVGEGWYRGIFRNLKSDSLGNNYGKKAGLLFRLILRYGNGRIDEVVSDESCQFALSNIRYSEFYDGELFDLTFKEQSWQPAVLLDVSGPELVKSIAPLVCKQESFAAKRLWYDGNKNLLVDFGQNMAGFVQFYAIGKKGDTIKVSHGEILDSNGRLYTGNLRNAKAQDIYVLADNKTILLEPHFTYHGFQYAEIECSGNVKLSKIKAIALYSDLKRTGTFKCSDEMLNRLQNNIIWSMRSNFVEVPTDCPQRSERLAWTGDAQVFAPTASFLYDTKLFYRKWLVDMTLEQGENGAVPNFAPTSSPKRKEFNGVAGWGDVATMIPWTLYQIYGDTITLRNQYASMKKWVDYITSTSIAHLWKNQGYGDWYAMGDSTSLHFIDQCFYVHSTEILVKASVVLGEKEDHKKYQDLLSKVKKAFTVTYGGFNTRETRTQTAYALALSFDLVEENEKIKIAGLLSKKIQENNGKLTTGFLGTPYLLDALSSNGFIQQAYELLLQKECPSWLYPITKGATTVWERWDAIRPDNSIQATSFNHYSYGAVGQWLYQNILGIRPLEPGYKKVLIRPLMNNGLRWAKGSYVSVNGKITVNWHRNKDNELILNLKLPKGMTGQVELTGNQSFLVKSGKIRVRAIVK